MSVAEAGTALNDDDQSFYGETKETLESALENAHRAANDVFSRTLQKNEDDIADGLETAGMIFEKLESITPSPFDKFFTLIGGVCGFAAKSITLKVECRRLSMRVLCLQTPIERIMNKAANDPSRIKWVQLLEDALDKCAGLLESLAPEPASQNESKLARAYKWIKRRCTEASTEIDDFDIAHKLLDRVMDDFVRDQVCNLEDLIKNGQDMKSYKLDEESMQAMQNAFALDLQNFTQDIKNGQDAIMKELDLKHGEVAAQIQSVSANLSQLPDAILDKLKGHLQNLFPIDANHFLDAESVVITHEVPLSSGGRLGDVYRGTFHGKQVAVKYYSRDICSDYNVALKKLENEVDNLMKVQFPNVVICFGKIRGDPNNHPADPPRLVLELGKIPLNEATDTASSPTKLNFTLDMLRGLAALSAKEVTHGDVKGNNLYIFDRTVKYIDFSAANATKRADCEPTWPYAAPEFIDGSAQVFNRQSDLYGLGVVLFEMWSGRPAYQSSQREDESGVWIRENVPKGTRPVGNIRDDSGRSIIEWMTLGAFDDSQQGLYKKIPLAIALIIYKLWEENPDDRGSVSQVRDFLAKHAEEKDNDNGLNILLEDDVSRFPKFLREGFYSNSKVNSPQNNTNQQQTNSAVVSEMDNDQLCEFLTNYPIKINKKIIAQLKEDELTGSEFVRASSPNTLFAEDFLKKLSPVSVSTFAEVIQAISGGFSSPTKAKPGGAAAASSNFSEATDALTDYYLGYIEAKKLEEKKAPRAVVRVCGTDNSAIDCLDSYLSVQNSVFARVPRVWIALGQELVELRKRVHNVGSSSYTAIGCLIRGIELHLNNPMPERSSKASRLTNEDLASSYVLLGQLLVRQSFGPSPDTDDADQFSTTISASSRTNGVNGSNNSNTAFMNKFSVATGHTQLTAVNLFERALNCLSSADSREAFSRASASIGYCFARILKVVDRRMNTFGGEEVMMNDSIAKLLETTSYFKDQIARKTEDVQSSSGGVSSATAVSSSSSSSVRNFRSYIDNTIAILRSALSCDNKCSRAWCALGYVLTLLPAETTVTILGATHTAISCFCNAHEIRFETVRNPPKAFTCEEIGGDIAMATLINSRRIIDNAFASAEAELAIADMLPIDPKKTLAEQKTLELVYHGRKRKFTRLDILPKNDPEYGAIAWRRYCDSACINTVPGTDIKLLQVNARTKWLSQVEAVDKALQSNLDDSSLWSRAAFQILEVKRNPPPISQQDFVTDHAHPHKPQCNELDCIKHAIQLDECNSEALALLLDLHQTGEIRKYERRKSNASLPSAASFALDSNNTLAAEKLLWPTAVPFVDALRIVLGDPAHSADVSRWWRLVSFYTPEENRTHAIGRASLARSLTSAQVCSQEVIRRDPKHKDAFWYLWFALAEGQNYTSVARQTGSDKNKTVSTELMTRYDIAVSAAERNQQSPLSWYALGSSLLFFGEHFTQPDQEIKTQGGSSSSTSSSAPSPTTTSTSNKARFIQITQHQDSPNSPHHDNPTASEPAAVINGKDGFTASKCFEQCLTQLAVYDANITKASNETSKALAASLVPYPEFRTKKFRALVWIRLALALCRNDPTSHFNEHTKATVSGKKYNALECAVEAYKNDSYLPRVWFILGNCIHRGKHVTVTDSNGAQQVISRDKCFIKVLEGEQTDATAWLALGEEMEARNLNQVVIQGKSLSAQQCYENAYNNITQAASRYHRNIRHRIAADARYHLAMGLLNSGKRNLQVADGLLGVDAILNACLNDEPQHAGAWMELGLIACDPKFSIQRQGSDLDAVKCFSMALTHSSTLVEFGNSHESMPMHQRLTPAQRGICWAMCGVLMRLKISKAPYIMYPFSSPNAQKYYAINCWEEAAQMNPKFVPRAAYEVAFFHGFFYNSARTEVARRNFESPTNPTMDSHKRIISKGTKKDTFELLRMAISNPRADYKAGITKRSLVAKNDDNTPRSDYIIEALQFVPVHCWKLLCTSLQQFKIPAVAIHGKQFTEQQLIEATLTKHDEVMGSSNVDTVEIYENCTTERLLSGYSRCQLWTRLGVLLTEDQVKTHKDTKHLGTASATVGANNKKYTEKDCFCKALEIRPDFAPAWKELAKYIDCTGAIFEDAVELTLGSSKKAFKRKECEEKFAEMVKKTGKATDVEFTKAWY